MVHGAEMPQTSGSGHRAAVKDDGEKKVEQSCITLGVITPLGHVLKLNLKMFFFGMDKGLWSDKTCHS